MQPTLAILTPSARTGPTLEFLPALTGVRAVAALWVVGYHLIPQVEALGAPWFVTVYKAVMSAGYLGVDLFFILSGFILALNYAGRFVTRGVNRRNYTDFLLARLARIYPVHIFTLLLLIPAVLAMRKLGLETDPTRFSPLAFGENIILVHGWHTNLYDRLSWNTPSWSISLEWLAYLFFPFIALTVFQKLRTVSTWWIPFLLTGALPLLMYSSGTILGFGFLDPYIRIGTEFTLGVFLFSLFRAGHFHSDHWGTITVGAVAGVLLICAAFYSVGYDNFAYSAVVLFPLIIYSLAQKDNAVSRLLSSRVAIMGGLISYSLYMTHNIWLMVAKAIIPAENFANSTLIIRIGIALLYFLPCLVIGAATYYIIEEPTRKRLNRLFKHATQSERASILP